MNGDYFPSDDYVNFNLIGIWFFETNGKSKKKVCGLSGVGEWESGRVATRRQGDKATKRGAKIHICTRSDL